MVTRLLGYKPEKPCATMVFDVLVACNQVLMVTKNRMNGKILTGNNAIKLYYSQKSKRIVSDPIAKKEYGCFRGAEKCDDMELDYL